MGWKAEVGSPPASGRSALRPSQSFRWLHRHPVSGCGQLQWAVRIREAYGTEPTEPRRHVSHGSRRLDFTRSIIRRPFSRKITLSTSRLV